MGGMFAYDVVSAFSKMSSHGSSTMLGYMLDAGVHWIAAMRAVMNQEPIVVSAQVKVLDLSAGLAGMSV